MKTANLSSKTFFLIFTITLASGGCNNKPDGISTNTPTDQAGTTLTDNAAIREQLPETMVFPDNFRNWHHVKSMILQEGHPLFENFGGIHHIYANNKAYEGYKNNKNFPDGSVIVFDLFEAISENNAIVEGNRKVIGVMYKNSKVFSETGGWEFGAYKNLNGEKLTIEWKSACFSCHASKKEGDYVFSDYRK
jgi:hypothetical protein